MSQLSILRYPDPRLHKVARPIAAVDDRIRQLADDMLETMYAADGVGLAATQVDVHERLIVIDTSEARDDPRVLINPELIWRSEEMSFVDEGCLSVPAIYDKVNRHARVRVRALDRDGQEQEFEADGLLSICVQHEIDHLDGKVFVEYLSSLKRDRIKTKMLKKARDDAARLRRWRPGRSCVGDETRLRRHAGVRARRRWRRLTHAGHRDRAGADPARSTRRARHEAAAVAGQAVRRSSAGLPVIQPRSLRLDGRWPDDAQAARAALAGGRARGAGRRRLRPDPAALDARAAARVAA